MTTPADHDRSVSQLPARPNLRYLKDRAKAMVKSGEADTLARAQLALARRYGFASWPTLKRHVESVGAEHGASATHRLIDAAGRGDLAEVKKQLKAGADLKHIYDLDEGYGSFAPPLKAAIENGHADCVRFLLRRGALDRVWGWDGLWTAQQRGDTEIERLLTEHRASQQTLIEAIRAGAHGRAAELLRADPTLATANEAGHGPMLPPLLAAADRGDARMVRTLLDAGADPAAEHHATSFNALTHALYHRHDEVAGLLEQRGVISDDITNYLFAAERGDLDRVKHYLAKGVDVNAKDHCEQHVFPHAFRSGNEALLQHLLDHGVDIRLSNGWEGYVWFADCIERGEVEAVRRILDLGYDVNHHDDHGHSPLSYAKQYKQSAVEALLRARGAAD